MSTAQLQTPSFLRPHIESDNIRLLLDGIEYREGNPSLVLTRCAADRPAWAIPAAVDLSDPLATKLLEMALRPSIRRLGGS